MKLSDVSIILIAVASISACGTTEYKQLNPNGIYGGEFGYYDTERDDGSYRLKVVYPNKSNGSEMANQFWDRRAEELCGSSKFQKDITAARRLMDPAYRNNMFPDRGPYMLEGFLTCLDDDGIPIVKAKEDSAIENEAL